MRYRMELLAGLLEKFVSGEDRSEDSVDRIGGVLIEFFKDSEIYEELISFATMYDPAGGQYMYDEETLVKEFAYALKRLREEEIC